MGERCERGFFLRIPRPVPSTSLTLLQMYPYIQSRYYRAPEILLGCPYSFPIDMWSLGCLLVELLTARPLFAGRDSCEQLYAIMDMLGPPPENVLAQAVYLNRYFRLDEGDSKLHPKKKYKWRRQGLWPLLVAAKGHEQAHHLAAFFDLVARMLTYDPHQRITPHQALEHAFILHGPAARQPGSTGAGITPSLSLGASAAMSLSPTSALTPMMPSSPPQGVPLGFGPPPPGSRL